MNAYVIITLCDDTCTSVARSSYTSIINAFGSYACKSITHSMDTIVAVGRSQYTWII